MTAPEKTRFLIVGFQTAKDGDQTRNPSTFVSVNLRDAYVMLNSDRYPAVDYNLSFTPALIIAHRPLSSFPGPYHRSSYTCSQPTTGYTAHLTNCTSVQPCPTTTCSSFSSLCLPTSPLFQFARRPTALLVLNPTSHQHKHTSI